MVHEGFWRDSLHVYKSDGKEGDKVKWLGKWHDSVVLSEGFGKWKRWLGNEGWFSNGVNSHSNDSNSGYLKVHKKTNQQWKPERGKIVKQK